MHYKELSILVAMTDRLNYIIINTLNLRSRCPIQMVHTGGSHKWFIQAVHTCGSREWCIYLNRTLFCSITLHHASHMDTTHIDTALSCEVGGSLFIPSITGSNKTSTASPTYCCTSEGSAENSM